MGRFKKGEGGRPVGAKNVISRSVKDCIAEAFHQLQKDPENKLEAWAKREPTEFYKIASKLIPTELGGKIELSSESDILIGGKKISSD